MTAPCPLTGGGHHWHLNHYEKYISRGTCACKAVSFFADTLDKEILSRVDLLNKKKAKEGKRMKGEVNRTTEHQEASSIAKSTVPARPSGRYEMKGYYDANKEAILFDLEQLGVKEMCRRWGISQATWKTTQKGKMVGLAVRWGLVPSGEASAPAEVKASSPQQEKSPSATKVTKGNHLLAFPPFDSSWPELVQLRWLDTYKDLAGRSINARDVQGWRDNL